MQLTLRYSFLILLCLFFSLQALQAQSFRSERNLLKLGVGLSHFNQDTDFSSPTLLLEFNRDFLPKTMIGVSLDYSLPQQFTVLDSLSQTSFALRFGLNLYYTLLDTRQHFALLGAGFSGSFQRNDLKGTDSVIIEIPENSFNPGISINFEYDYVLTDTWILGGRGSLFFYETGDKSWYLGAQLGMRF